MSQWLDLSNNSNKFKQSYFRNFVDVSGEVLIRNGQSLKFYNNSVPTRTQFSINSDELRIFNENDQTYYDISNTKLIYLKDLTNNVQTQLDTFNEKTRHFATDTTNLDTMVELDASNNIIIIHSALDVSYDIIGSSDLSINRNIYIGGDASFNSKLFVQSDVSMDSTLMVADDVSLNSKLFVLNNVNIGNSNTASDLIISGNILPLESNTSNLGSLEKPFNSLYVSDNTINLVDTTGDIRVVTALSARNGLIKIRRNEITPGQPSVDEIDQTVIFSVDDKTGFGILSSEATATVDVSGNIRVRNDASFNGRVDICGNFYAQYPENSIPTSAIIGGGSGGSIDPDTNVSLNQNFSLGGDASFNGRVDICGNLYANYPTDSIPLSAVSNLLTNLNNKANIDSPNFTGIPTATTANSTTNTTQLATTAFVQNRISEIIDAAPETLDTLNELAAALGDDANFSTTITTLIGDNSNNLNIEINRATSAEGILTTSIGDVSDNLAIEVTRAIASEGVVTTLVGDVSDNLAIEVTRAIASEGVVTTLVGDISDNLAIEVTRASVAEGVLTTLVGDVSDNLATEVTRAIASEGVVTTLVGDVSDNLATEVSRATTAESGLTALISDVSGNLATEITRAINAESGLTTLISDISDTLVTKAPLANPTFTGILNADNMNITNDTSFNGRVDICGNFYANYPDSSIPASAIIGGGGGGSIDPDTDVSLNQKLAVGGDVSLNSNVDISESLTVGTLQAEYSSVTINDSAQWTQVGSDLVGSYSGERFGSDNVDLNADGTILVAGGHKYNGSVGRVVVLKYNGSSWIQLGQTIYGNTEGEYWGVWNSINAAGDIIAIGSHAASGSRGRVDMYQYNEITSTWDQLGQSIIGGTGNGLSGYGISLSENGYTVVIGAVGLNQSFVYRYNGSTWQQLGNTIAGAGGDNVGSSVDINSDGTIVALGTSTTTIKIFTLVNSTWNLLGNSISTGSGAFNRLALSYDGSTVVAGDNGSSKVRVYKYVNSAWIQIGQEIVKSGSLGYSVSINYDGSIIAAAAYGIGQAFIYQYDGSSWVQIAQTITAKSSGDRTGDSISLNRDGTTMAVGSSFYNNTGLVRIFEIAHTGGYSSSGSANNSAVTIYYPTNFYGDVSFNGAVYGLTADDVGLENVDNTSDANKPISTATQTALDLKSNINSPTFTGIPAAPTAGAGTNTTQLATTSFVTTAVSSKANLASPALTGTPTAPTAGAGTNTTQLATTAFVSSAITNLVSGAPGALDTLNELAAALGDDANFSTTITNSLASKAPLANPTFTGRVDICGNLYAQYPDSSIPASAIIGGVGGGGGGTIDPNTDVSLNQKLAVGGDVSLNSNVNISESLTVGMVLPPELSPVTINNGAQWTQIGTSINGISANEAFGDFDNVGINKDGTIVIAGAKAYQSNTGRVVVFKYDGSSWSQLGQTIVGSGTAEYWGGFTSINAAGNIIAVSSQVAKKIIMYIYNDATSNWDQLGQTISSSVSNFGWENKLCHDGYTVVVGGATSTNSCYVYRYNGSSWQQLGNDITGASGDVLGLSVDINSDGTIVALGTLPTTIKVYTLINTTWTILGGIITTGASSGRFDRLALSSDGYTVVAGDADSGSFNNNAGRFRVYRYINSTWVQLGQEIVGTVSAGYFGRDVAISWDGSIVAVGGDYANVVNIYQYNGSSWIKIGQSLDGLRSGDKNGASVALSADGTIVAFGAPGYDTTLANVGQVSIFEIAHTGGYSAPSSNNALTVYWSTNFYGDISFNGTINGLTADDVGLENVDNTSDANKPISTATQTALDLKSNINSPTFTGIPSAPTAGAGTNTTQLATTQFVSTAITNLVSGAPGALDTLNELAAALGDDANFSTTITNSLASKAPLANPTFTGRVDICGNLYAQYPDSSIPASAIIGGVGGVGGGDVIDISSNQTISGIKTFENGLVIGQAQFNVINQTSTENVTTDSSAVTINPTSTWSQTGGDFDGIAANNKTGARLALNSEGNIIAVASVATSGFGYVKVYRQDINKTSADSYGPIGWNQIGQTITSTLATGAFGEGITLNSDGYVLALGHALSANNNGLTYVYSYNTTTNEWIQRGDTIVGEAANNYSGRAISLSADGTIIAIDAYGNSDGAAYRGHVRVYKYDANKTVADTNQSSSTFGPVGWNRLGQDIDGESAGDWSGFYTALSSDGTIVAIGAYAANGYRGQVRVYKYDVNKTTANADQSSATYGPVGWNRLGQDIDGDPSTTNYAGVVSLNSDGTIVAIGGYISNSNTGHVRVYKYDVNKTVADTNQSSSTFGPVGWNRLGQDLRGSAVNNLFGHSVSLNSLGNILAVGIPGANRARLYLYDINKTSEDLNTSSSTFGPVGWNRIGQDLTGPSSSATGNWVRVNSVGNIVAYGAPEYNSATGKAFVYSIPTTGTSNTSSSVTTIISSSIEINSAVDICGNFYAQYPDNSIPASAIIGGVGVDANSDVSLNQNLSIGGDASFNGRVDICGNLYAQYPDSSIPPSAIIGGVGGVSDNLSISNLNVSGNVGIGTSNPEKPLHVIGDSKIGSLNLTTITSQSGIVYDASWVQVGNTVEGVAMTEDPQAPYIGYTTSLNADGTIMAHGSYTGYVNIYKYRYITQAEWDTSPSDDRNISVVKYQDTVFDPNKQYWIQIGNSIRDTIGSADHYSSVALNATGNIIVIAGFWDDTYATNAGIGKVFTYNSNTDSWTKLGQDVYGVTNDYLGTCVDINADGTIVAYGTYYANSYQGKIQVFQYNSGTNQWVQLGQTFTGGQFGVTLSLSSDGYTLACGTAAYMTALVYKYSLDTQTFQQVGGSIPYEVNGDRNGNAVSLTQDGSIVAIGSQWSDSTNATVYLNRAGQVRVFEYRLVTADEWAETATPNRSGVVIKNGDATLNVTKKYWVQLGNDILGINPDHRLGSQVFIRKTTDHGIILAGGEAARVYTFQYRSITEDEWNAPTINNNNMGVIKGNDTVYNSEKSYWIQIGGDIVKPSDAYGSFGSNKFGFNSSGTTIVTSTPNTDNGFGRVFVYNLPYRALNFQNDSVIDTLDNNSRRNLVLNNTLSIDASNNTTFTGRVDICGNLYAQYPNSSIPPSAIIGGVGVDANSDVSLNQNLSIGGDASFNGRVDICGNFYAQYPDNSIPASAIIGGVGSSGTTVSDPVAFVNDFAIITGAGQEVTLNEDNFALIKPLPYGQVGSYDITFLDNFALIKEDIEPQVFTSIKITKNLIVENLATFTGIVNVNTPINENNVTNKAYVDNIIRSRPLALSLTTTGLTNQEIASSYLSKIFPANEHNPNTICRLVCTDNTDITIRQFVLISSIWTYQMDL